MKIVCTYLPKKKKEKNCSETRTRQLLHKFFIASESESLHARQNDERTKRKDSNNKNEGNRSLADCFNFYDSCRFLFININ